MRIYVLVSAAISESGITKQLDFPKSNPAVVAPPRKNILVYMHCFTAIMSLYVALQSFNSIILRKSFVYVLDKGFSALGPYYIEGKTNNDNNNNNINNYTTCSFHF